MSSHPHVFYTRKPTPSAEGAVAPEAKTPSSCHLPPAPNLSSTLYTPAAPALYPALPPLYTAPSTPLRGESVIAKAHASFFGAALLILALFDHAALQAKEGSQRRRAACMEAVEEVVDRLTAVAMDWPKASRVTL